MAQFENLMLNVYSSQIGGPDGANCLRQPVDGPYVYFVHMKLIQMQLKNMPSKLSYTN